ncbi:MAG: PepSY domain-containing protein [Pontixanthobacter sp.]
MANRVWMRRFAKWHIWLGWLVGVPIVMWMVTGLVMVSKPIEEVRGNHLRREVEQPALPANTDIAVSLSDRGAKPVRSVTTAMQDGQPVTTFEYMDGSMDRFGADDGQLPLVSEAQARQIVADQIVGNPKIVSTIRFGKDKVPFDFRRPMPVWQVALEDGSHIYIGEQTGKIEAVRTRWWRVFDFMWGLHIMDLQTREDSSHPILILFAALGVIGSVLGCILMFRRRKARVRAG